MPQMRRDIEEEAWELFRHTLSPGTQLFAEEHDLLATANEMIRCLIRREDPNDALLSSVHRRILWDTICVECKNALLSIAPPMEEDPFAAAFDKDFDKEMKPKLPTAPGKRSISEMIVMRDFLEMATTPTDFSGWNSLDRELLDRGVRVGQSWTITSSHNVTLIAPLGYHKTGFLWVGITRNNPVGLPHLYSVRAIDDFRRILASYVKGQRQVVCNVSLDTTIQARYLDEAGFALPGYEIEAALSPLRIRPMFWRDPISGRDFFVSLCEEGHFIFSEKQIAVGCTCSQDCQDSKRTAAARSLFDQILHRAIHTEKKKTNVNFTDTSSSEKVGVYAPYTIFDISGECTRLLTAFSTPEIKSPTWLKKQKSADLFSLSAKVLKDEGIRSGDILPLNIHDSGERIFAKAHRRACGYFHFELSQSFIFSGETDKTLLSRIIRSSHFSFGSFDKECYLRQPAPFVRCPICKSNNPVAILVGEEDKKKGDKHLTPITSETIKKNIIPTYGDIVFYRKKPHIVCDHTNPTNENVRTLVMHIRDIKGTKLSIPFDHIKVPNAVSQSVKNMFYDEDGFLKEKKIHLTNWMRTIVPGSILVSTRPDMIDVQVTCTSVPFKMASEWYVRIAESGTPMSLHTELRAKKTYPIHPSANLQIANKTYTIKELENGIVSVHDFDGNLYRIPKLGLDLIKGRGVVRETVPIVPLLEVSARRVKQK